MIFFVRLAEVLFTLYVAIKSVSYGIYNIKEKNKSGGVLVFTITGIMLFLMAVSLFK